MSLLCHTQGSTARAWLFKFLLYDRREVQMCYFLRIFLRTAWFSFKKICHGFLTPWIKLLLLAFEIFLHPPKPGKSQGRLPATKLQFRWQVLRVCLHMGACVLHTQCWKSFKAGSKKCPFYFYFFFPWTISYLEKCLYQIPIAAVTNYYTSCLKISLS